MAIARIIAIGAAIFLSTVCGCTVARHELRPDGTVISQYSRFMTDAAIGSITKDGDSFLIESYKSDAHNLADLLEALAKSLRAP
jgi:hypothetical protein